MRYGFFYTNILFPLAELDIEAELEGKHSCCDRFYFLPTRGNR